MAWLPQKKKRQQQQQPNTTAIALPVRPSWNRNSLAVSFVISTSCAVKWMARGERRRPFTDICECQRRSTPLESATMGNSDLQSGIALSLSHSFSFPLMFPCHYLSNSSVACVGGKETFFLKLQWCWIWKDGCRDPSHCFRSSFCWLYLASGKLGTWIYRYSTEVSAGVRYFGLQDTWLP